MPTRRNSSGSANQLSTASQPLSWTPPEICWTSASGLIGLRASINFDLIEFVAKGTHESVLLPEGVHSDLEELKYGGWLINKLLIVANAKTLLRPPIEHSKEVVLHLHGVFILPCLMECLVLIGREPPHPSGSWLSERLKEEAFDICAQHYAARDAYKADRARRLADLPPKYREAMERMSVLPDLDEPSRPKTDPSWLMRLCPRVVAIDSRRKEWSRQLENRALRAISQSGWPSSRDGQYEGILPLMIGGNRSALVVWEPYQGLPAYPEVRWCVQRRLPRAVREPRLTRSERPELDLSNGADTVISGIFDEAAELIEVLQDVHRDFPLEDRGGPVDDDGHDRIESVKGDLVKRGFEAIAWFQPYHIWSEETWGICIDAPKLDDFALSLLEDFRQCSIRAHHLAAPLAVGLVHAHELFHARVEAALSWIEVNAGRPRHLRYRSNVYNKTYGRSECLEEALAHWCSWQWFKSHQGDFTGNVERSETLGQVIKNVLDLSPPGYHDWRIGHDSATWKAFATQMVTGSLRAPVRRTALPLDSILTGPFPYNFRLDDVPLRFSGRGLIANRLLSHPATFQVPSLPEMQKALRHFNFKVDQSKGKGSHQKWTAPNQRFFILPTRNPVSRCVFRSFLNQVGIDKSEYVSSVRPML